MKGTTFFCVGLAILIAPFATAQIPCGPTIIPMATLFVNWPQFQYDIGHSGCNPYESILSPNTASTLAQKWQRQARVAWSSSVLADGALYVNTVASLQPYYNSVSAIDAGTGWDTWSFDLQYTYFSSPVVANGIVYAGASDDNLYALNAKTGALLWQHTTAGQAVYPPAVANGVVYVSSGSLYALNATTGALIWQSPDGFTFSPAVANGVVYSVAGGLYALNATTGNVIWEYQTLSSASSSPVVAGGRVYVNSYENNLYAVSALTGSLIWTFPVASTLPPAVDRNTVYVADNVSKIYALNAATGALKWTYDTHDDLISSPPVVANGLVYLSSDHNLTVLNASTGAQVWLMGTGVNTSSPTVANGIVYVGTQPYGIDQPYGNLTAFSLQGH